MAFIPKNLVCCLFVAVCCSADPFSYMTPLDIGEVKTKMGCSLAEFDKQVLFEADSVDVGLKVTLEEELKGEYLTAEKLVIASIGGNGAAVLESVRRKVKEGNYKGFRVIFIINYLTENQHIGGPQYQTCIRILRELKNDLKVDVRRYENADVATPHCKNLEQLYLSTWEVAANEKFPTITGKDLEEALVTSKAIVDAIVGTGRQGDDNSLAKLGVTIFLINEMAKVKNEFPDKTKIISNDCVSGALEDGSFQVGVIGYRANCLMSMHWNKNLVNNTKYLLHTKIYLLKFVYPDASWAPGVGAGAKTFFEFALTVINGNQNANLFKDVANNALLIADLAAIQAVQLTGNCFRVERNNPRQFTAVS